MNFRNIEKLKIILDFVLFLLSLIIYFLILLPIKLFLSTSKIFTKKKVFRTNWSFQKRKFDINKVN
jgi:hypothetical protein